MNKGVRKSASDVIKGIRKLFGSVPRLKRLIALKNNKINMIKKIISIVRNMIKIIIKGFTICTPEIIPTEKPTIMRNPKLNKSVSKRP